MEYGLISHAQIQSYTYAKMAHNMFGGYEYILHNVPLHGIKDFIEKGQFKGINLYEPYKEVVIPFCHDLSPIAKKLGAVSTITKMDNRITGHNTDYNAIIYMINRSGIRLKGKKVIIYGNSGTSRAAQLAAEYFGAREIIRLFERGPNGYNLIKENTDAEIIVSTDHSGDLSGTHHNLINLSLFPLCEGVVECVHNPLRSALILSAKEKGIPTTDPLNLLAAKTKYSSELFVGRMVADERIRQVARKLKREMSNIVLIGMPGCGKTAVGKYLSQKLGRGFLDINTIIEQKSSYSINQIIEREGESAVRNIESKIIGNVGRQNGKVIAVGSGAVLAESNYSMLKQNGVIIFLERSATKINAAIKSSGTNPSKIEQLRTQRLPRFLHFADCTVDNNSSIQQTGERVLEAFLSCTDEFA